VAFVTDADVKVIHDRIAAEWSATAQAASAESVKLSPEQITQLGVLGSRMQGVLGDSPAFWRAAAQMNAAEALERDLFTYVASLRASGVTNLPAPSAGPAPSAIDKIVELAPMILLAVVLLSIGTQRK
jgi:hypothetical protein